MNNVGYAFLAIGERYTQEFLSISKLFPKEDIIVCSDKQIEDYNTLIVKDNFNFNLKSIPIIECLKKYKTVVSIDTDHRISPSYQNILKKIPVGVSVKHIRNEVIYLGEKITSDNLRNGLTKYEDVNLYGMTLNKLLENHKLKFLDESLIIFNFENNIDKNNFIENYSNLILKTKNKQPFRHTDKKMGSMEGCIIYGALELSNIQINDDLREMMYKYFHHYGPLEGHNTKLKNDFLI